MIQLNHTPKKTNGCLNAVTEPLFSPMTFRAPRDCSTGHFVRRYGLKPIDAHRISWFVYLVKGETNQAFIEAMNAWVREHALSKGSVQDILDAILILSVTQIDFDEVHTCEGVRREVIRSVQRRYPMPRRIYLKPAA